MLAVPAHRVRQFGVEFYQACFTAADIDRLVRFEVLGYAGSERESARAARRKAGAPQVNWAILEKRISESGEAFQRPLIRKKIQELLAYYRECRDAQNLPAIPGSVIMIAERRLEFKKAGGNPNVGLLQIPEEAGILRALDGQHRLLALHAAGEGLAIDVPAVVFDSLDARQVVELFVTINAKHTRLNPSHLLSLAGRRLYSDAQQALAHDVIRRLNQEEGSPLRGEIKMLGVGRGRVSQAPINEEMVALFKTAGSLGGPARLKEFQAQAPRLFLNYFKAIEAAFPRAWAGKKYSIKTGAALRAFIRVAPDVMERARQVGGDAYDFHAIRQAVAPWGPRLGDQRFETEGEWRTRLAGGTRSTVDVLARELRDALARG